MQLISSLLMSSTTLASRDAVWMYFTQSQVFTPSQDMEVNIHVLGAGGTGGAYSASTPGIATGAGAGGYAIKRATLKAGVSYTITIGAAGATVGAGGGISNGNDGAATSFVGGSLNIVANGGKGGKAGVMTTALLGGLGGTATGGDKNYTGGRGGNIAANATSVSNAFRATGGGALNIFGIGKCDGGDLTGTAIISANNYQTTGGGSCTANGISDAGNVLVNTYMGDIDILFGPLTRTGSSPVALKNRTIFGAFDTIGPIPPYGTPGNFVGGTANSGSSAGAFAGGPGQAATASPAQSLNATSNSLGVAAPASAGGAACGSAGGAATSFAPRNGCVMLEVLG